MALTDESPNERQERLERHEDLMQRRDERLATRTRADVHGSSSVGKGMGDFVGALGDHKMLIIGGVGVAIVAIMVYSYVKNQNSAAAQSANLSPNYANAGYIPSDLSTQLDSINSQLSAQGAQIGQIVDNNKQTTTTPSSSLMFPGTSVQVGAGGIDINGQRWWEKFASGAQYLFYLPQGSRVFQQNGNWMYQTPNSTVGELTGQAYTVTQLPSGTSELLGISQSSGNIPKLSVNTNIGG